MPDMNLVKETYLGDGVYAHFDGWYVILQLSAQDPKNRIALEPEVMTALMKYVEQLKKENSESA
ncbi:MAG: hypothetical protein HQ513_05555 [Rhodospirillales bacterium]|nr:hypothetical protein [Rhodospirillales bacterium]